jgi:hypothetical protein
MNRNEFLHMIEDTVQMNRQMIGDVYELINIFPYFQSAHMILLKGLQNNADVKFETQLRNSAIHIADREVLYYFLNRKFLKEAEQSPVINEEQSVKDPDYNTQQTVIESAKNSEDLIYEIEKDSGGTESLEESDTVPPATGHSILNPSESENDDSAGIILVPDDDSPDNNDRIFYMDPGILVPDNDDLLELDLGETRQMIFEKDDSDQELLRPEDNNSKKQQQSELIDKFIIANPRIEPNRNKTDYPVEDISKTFVEETGGFVTETLARIYISQGYYSKAIDIYEKLSLKFPEKSSYFASQIEMVKEFIKT